MDRDEADFDPRREDGGGAAENMTRTELVMGTEADHKAGQLGRSEEGSKEKNRSSRALDFLLYYHQKPRFPETGVTAAS